MLKKVLSFENTPVIGLLIVCLIVGGFTVKDYGQSWDEIPIYNYANHSIQSYQYLFHPDQLEPFSGNLNNYGPSYFMIAMTGSRLINKVVPSLSHIDSIHFVFFLTLLACLLILYLLARRWMSTWAAFGTVLLFASQPLIWGHAFINPKDTPFMMFFLASIYLGLQMLDTPGNSKWVWMIAAAVMLGLTISFRVIGPWAGALVFLYGLFKFPRRLIGMFPLYLLIAAITSYLTWPYLWNGPVAVFLESLQMMSQFPLNTPVLFFGDIYQPSELPRSYFPVLLGLQLTEPALFLITAGLVVSVVIFIRNKQREPLLLFAGWFLLPALWVILSHSSLYDNARQLLFLWPALFLLAGLGIDWLISLLKSNLFKASLVVAIALPGVVACMQLHPYQYVYYNSLAGGVGGAYRNFELDYWVTSFKESMEYLNEHAEEGATVVIHGNRPVARQYARPDLNLILPGKLDESEVQKSYYILSTTRAGRDELQCGEAAEIVFDVERDGGVLAYIEKVSADQPCK
jgi:hypothetical protein